jgi:pyruvate dehydrogenase E1 component
MIGMAQDGLAAFEPAFADELAIIMRWAFDYMQRDANSDEATSDDADWLADGAGGSVYLRLSTRSVAQAPRDMDEQLSRDIIDGAYWLRAPAAGASLAVVYTGAVAGEAIAAHQQLLEDLPGAGVLAVTSADRLAKGWHAINAARRQAQVEDRCHVEKLLAPLAADAHLVTVIDGHPATLGWLGSVLGQRVRALGVERFGQSGSIDDLYRHHGIDSDAILDACAAACLDP